jgi:hypothetical protein
MEGQKKKTKVTSKKEWFRSIELEPSPSVPHDCNLHAFSVWDLTVNNNTEDLERPKLTWPKDAWRLFLKIK